MLAHAYYEEDSRVRRQAESLVSAGRPVDVFALRRVGDAPSDVIAGVQLSRLPVSRHQGAGLATYLREYAEFFGRAAIALARAHRRRRYAPVQVHTLPDFLVFAALPLRMARVPVLLDLHEAMPEFFRSRFPRRWGALAVRALEIQETLATSFADAVVTVNDALADRLVRRGVRPGKVTVIVNGPARDLFAPWSLQSLDHGAREIFGRIFNPQMGSGQGAERTVACTCRMSRLSAVTRTSAAASVRRCASKVASRCHRTIAL